MELSLQSADYEQLRPVYIRFTGRLSELIETLLAESSVQIHTIEKRTKSADSFDEKSRRPDKGYTNPLTEITDLTGVRVIAYYQRDVDAIGHLIRSQLDVDESRSNDARNTLRVDQFGYLSTHYVINLDSRRAALPEWAMFKGLNAEIQVRTVLQHAWAGISHALQYKREEEMPAAVGRRLFRLAGLLELADEEFSSISREVATIEQTVSAEPMDAVEPIHRASILKVVNDSPEAVALIAAAADAGFEVENDLDGSRETISSVAWLLNRLDIDSTKEFRSVLHELYPVARRFFEELIAGDTKAWVIDDPFAVFLSLLLRDRSELSSDSLVSEHGWAVDIAEYVVGRAAMITD